MRTNRVALPLPAAIVLLLALSTPAAAVVPPTSAPLHLKSPVQDKNFYLLSGLEADAAVRAALGNDTALAKLARSKRDALSNAVVSCEVDLDCYADATTWTDQESATVVSALTRLYRDDPDVARFVDGPLRASGMFQRWAALPGSELLARAWLETAKGLGHVIAVYGTGAPPRYATIDAVTYKLDGELYHRMVATAAAVANDAASDDDLFFEPSLRFAMLLLEVNARDEAGRLEPLEQGENAATVRRMSSIDWSRYPYSVILVPGSGPGRADIRLSPIGTLRLVLAAKRFREGKAPILVVSGGYVHPEQTPYCEALEMKRYLVEKLGVPADAILVEPHARHTTTNIRNTARLIYRYGIPFDRMMLVTTTHPQSADIESASFAKRCLDELGYLPYELGKRLSPFDLELRPAINSLTADPMAPLDP